MYVVYALEDQHNHEVFYVGITDNIFTRFMAHLRCSGSNYEKNARITKMRQENTIPLCVELERVEDIGLARVREIYWINHYRMLGHPITNVQNVNLRFVKSVLVRSSKKVHALLKQSEKISPGRAVVEVLDQTTQPHEDSEQFIPEAGHPMLSDLQIKLFTSFYEDCGNIETSLSRIKNDKGQGLGKRYSKHASWIVKRYGLRKGA